MGGEAAVSPQQDAVDCGLCCFGFLHKRQLPHYPDNSYENPYWAGLAERLRRKGVYAVSQGEYGNGTRADLCLASTLPDGKMLVLWIEGKVLWKRCPWHDSTNTYYYQDGHTPRYTSWQESCFD